MEARKVGCDGFWGVDDAGGISLRITGTDWLAVFFIAGSSNGWRKRMTDPASQVVVMTMIPGSFRPRPFICTDLT